MLRVPLAGGVEQLLPVAEVAQGDAAVARDVGPLGLVLHQQHAHHHQAHSVLQAGVAVDLGRHRHDGQQVVLRKTEKENGGTILVTRMAMAKTREMVTNS